MSERVRFNHPAAVEFEGDHHVENQYALMPWLIAGLSRVNEGHIYSTNISAEIGFLDDITPYDVKVTNSDVRLLYCDVSGDEQEISLDLLPGLAIVRSDGSRPHEEKGELLVEFTYLNSGSQEMEESPRRMRVNGIAFGRHEGHPENESGDFYLVGEDTQYDPEDSGAGQRRFPFWRMGVYGNPEELMPRFLPN
ncbi:hypothetical protein ACFL1M_03400 [Patescibacteria group bacterium]